MARQSPEGQWRPLSILLIEDDPIDAAWIAEHIKQTRPGTEVVHTASLPDALLVLAKRLTDAIFISVHPDGRAASTQECRRLVRSGKGRPVVALINVAQMGHADDVRATGVQFIYRKHPIMRTAHIRKLEVREKVHGWIGEQQARIQSASPTAAHPR